VVFVLAAVAAELFVQAAIGYNISALQAGGLAGRFYLVFHMSFFNDEYGAISLIRQALEKKPAKSA
jgi:hypothetical protein